MAVVLAGGGLKGGYGTANGRQGMAPATMPARRTTCRPRCSIAWGWTPTGTHDPSGRPVQLFREGRVIEKLLA